MDKDRRVTCSRHHWLFSVTAEGIAIKCRAGECRAVYIATWEEIEEKRSQVVVAKTENELAIVASLPLI